MKYSFILVLIFSCLMLNAQTNKAITVPATTPVASEEVVERSNAKMEFESTTVDYGTIEYDADPLRKVKFTNTGTEPLIIKNAKGSCGCTVPKWPNEPIAPGQSSFLEVRYDTKRTGRIMKSISVTTNEGPEEHRIQVIGEVLPKKEDSSVPNAEPTVIKG